MLTPLDIKIELLKRGKTGGDVARRIGVTRGLVSLVIARKRRSVRTRKAVCEVLGLQYEEVWGEKDSRAA